jgi:hypothetical protein
VSVIVRQIRAALLQLTISLRRDTEGVRDRSQMAETLSRSVTRARAKGGCQFQDPNPWTSSYAGREASMNVLPGSLSAWADLGQPGRSGVWKGMINDPSLCGVACHTHALGELVFRNALRDGPHSACAAYFRLARRALTGARFAVERDRYYRWSRIPRRNSPDRRRTNETPGRRSRPSPFISRQM